MRLFAAIVARLLKNFLIIGLIMVLLFIGYLAVENLWPSVQSFLNSSEQLENLQAERLERQSQLEQTDAALAEQNKQIDLLREQIIQHENVVQSELETSLAELQQTAALQKQRLAQVIEQNQQRHTQALAAIDLEYCRTYNPLKWLTCQAMRQRVQTLQNNMHAQRQALAQTAAKLEENARQEAENLRIHAQNKLEQGSADLQNEIAAILQQNSHLEAERHKIIARFEELASEEQRLKSQNWLLLEFKQRWPGLLTAALIIFFAPYIRRTLWYFIGMPLVSRAAPIQLTDPAAPGTIEASSGERTISLTVPASQSLRARSGYIQSDQIGARTDLFFDWKSPNLSYLSGLVLLTRLDAPPAPNDTMPQTAQAAGRTVTLGSPDDADAYLMELRLEDHPGVVLRARNIVAVVGDIHVHSRWRLTSWHAWATSQIRFLVFSGTGSIILEGYGDIAAQPLDPATADTNSTEKRMPLVVGFDTRLAYKTRRTATFLPYLINPNREPLVVDVFEGSGAFLYQKNPTSNAQKASITERTAGFFLDSIRNLLGI